MIKIEFSVLILAFLLIAGCESNCIQGADRSINVSVGENQVIQTNMGLSNHHNVTVNIVNTVNSEAKSVRVWTYFCNDNKFLRGCENNSFNIESIPANSEIKKYFEYDRVVGQDTLTNYGLQYTAESCLPITTINNSVYIIQR